MRNIQQLDDAMGRSTPIINPPEQVMVVQLAAGTPRLVAVPPAARSVLFNATAAFWAKIGAAVLLPLADILDGSAPELNPQGRCLDGAGNIGLVAGTACTVSLSFFG